MKNRKLTVQLDKTGGWINETILPDNTEKEINFSDKLCVRKTPISITEKYTTISNGNYWISEDDNRLIITLPQTFGTNSGDTSIPFEIRREYLTDEELSLILGIVKNMYTKVVDEEKYNKILDKASLELKEQQDVIIEETCTSDDSYNYHSKKNTIEYWKEWLLKDEGSMGE